MNGISCNQFQTCNTNWIGSVLTISRHVIPMVLYSTSSRSVIPIELYHIVPVPDIWYQLNSISFYQFQICVWYQLNGISFDKFQLVIPIEWYQNLPVPDIWYQLNSISSNQFQSCGTNWMLSVFSQINAFDTNWM